MGLAPSDIGGLNGPHGAFLAPSYLVVKEADINIDVTIDRAIAYEQPVTATATSSTNGQQTTNDTNTPTPTASSVSVTMAWPRPGQVLHWGAFPGEIGNCIILGTQVNLADLRKLQQNDEVKLYDRAGNIFTYRILAFSPTGQPERVIDLTNPADNWIFAKPDASQAAVLTIIVSMPQPQPPINAQAEVQVAQSVKDDFTTTKKLAYRAVLVSFAPNVSPTNTAAGAGAGLNATQVGVDSSVWQTQPMATIVVASAATPVIGTTNAANNNNTNANPATTTVSSAAPAQAQTTTATPTPPEAGNLPSGLPDTGQGGGARHNT